MKKPMYNESGPGMHVAEFVVTQAVRVLESVLGTV